MNSKLTTYQQVLAVVYLITIMTAIVVTTLNLINWRN
jgi:hypothetical protein